ncbi:galactose mutarotase [Macrococcoides goetzii]|nr:aldose epimerase family protein [Macrococcus goetzii]TDM45624.1 galactose mutarotase [Macrococcus goetzii]
MNCNKVYFDAYQDKEVHRYIITTNDLVFEFLDFGARIHKIYQKLSLQSNIVLSFNSIQSYLESATYAGATTGRVAGRIKNGTFNLNDKQYHLDINNPPHHLHGGEKGMDKMIYKTDIINNENSVALNFTATLYEEDDYYPGNIDVTIRHTVDINNTWTIEYFAKTSEDTIFNPTNHVYFNLNQNFEQKIYNHELKISGSEYCEIDSNGLPTGNILKKETFNFNKKKDLIKGFMCEGNGSKIVGGYDHPFLLDGGKKLELSVPSQNLAIEADTDRDCVIIYTANGLDYQTETFHYQPHCAVAIEFQQIPDAINNQLSNIVLKKDEPFYSKSRYTIKRRG